MQSNRRYSQVWVKVAIGSGILLGLVLLVQTITTYFFVYNKLIHEEAAQEAERKVTALGRTAASLGITDMNKIAPALRLIQEESPRQIAWMRALNIDSRVVAQTGNPLSKPLSSDQLHHMVEFHQLIRKTVRSAHGEVLVMVFHARLSLRRGDGPPRGLPTFIEVAIYVEGVSVNFTPLRQNLIVGCLAAIALLGSMVLISIFFNRYIKARELEQQVELARSVQADLLPSSEAANPSPYLQFAAAFFPAAVVGGDFYDVFKTEAGPISIVLGDVAGKGISAALLMGVLHGSIRSMNWSNQEASARQLNLFLCEKTARERFVSLFLAYFDPEQASLRYVNAGHLPPLLVRKSGVIRLGSGGPVLGLLPAASYLSSSVPVDAGDTLVVFSDGVAEATNEKDEEYGDHRIANIVCDNLARDPQTICDLILRDVSLFLGRLKPHDDQTLLVVRLEPASLQLSGMNRSEAEFRQ
jgi:hypothetical protein